MSTTTADDTTAGVTGGGRDGPLLQVRDLRTHFDAGPGLLSGLLGRLTGGADGDGRDDRGRVVRACDGVSFDVEEGEVFGLVGESGSGKTTLGRTILRLVDPTSGSIRMAGRELSGLTQDEIRPLRRNMALIFQDPAAALNPAMTIAEGVGHPLRIHGLVDGAGEARREVAAMLERVGLTPAHTVLDKYPEDVSGGQKQRVVIARALITNPRFVVADEPVASLDMSIRARVLELMLELKNELGLTYLFITHDLATARFMCDRMAILYLGQIVEQGTAERLFTDPQHPYTRALLDAIPLPDPSRRDRRRELPHGEIPDAVDPPAGCRFHPRCPQAFEPCGWEGRDLVDALEERWTNVDGDTVERELQLFGPVAEADVRRGSVRFPDTDTAAVASWLDEHGPSLATDVTVAITDVHGDGGGTVVRFGPGPEPGPQQVAGRKVACHLHGVVPRDGGLHVGDPGAVDPDVVGTGTATQSP